MDDLVAFLTEAGADRLPHARGRTLLDHLVGTAEILRAWRAPEALQRAALLHSVYGTSAYRHQLFGTLRRPEVAKVAGEEAERLAFLFGTVPRRPLLAGTLHWAPVQALGNVQAPAPQELDALILLHMANLAEQSAAPDGGPAPWLSKLTEYSRLLEHLDPPNCLARLGPDFDASRERSVLGAYRQGLRSTGAERIERFAYAAAACPVLAEPCLWLATAAAAEGEETQRAHWVSEAEHRFHQLGTAWDKRMTPELWLQSAVSRAPAGAARPPGTAKRFLDYLGALSDDPRAAYPGLTAQPFWDPATFPLAKALSRDSDAIRTEVKALEPGYFQPESERIDRTGSWDVVFLYDRGRRQDDNCARLPTLARIVESEPSVVRASAGLIYVSRLRAGTHVAAHRGPTNVRLRCHLGITVPEGDCAIRVGDQVRPWREGDCLILDDHHEHEAWNRTDRDRIVVIVDLWHPDLEPREVELLSALDRHTARSARRLAAYWRNNDAAHRG